MKARTVPHQCAHICYGRSFSHLGALSTWSRILPPRCGFTRQATLINLEVGGGQNAEISGDTVACGEGDKVARHNLIRKEVYVFSVADDVTVMRN
jgi:hypothetical protein